MTKLEPPSKHSAGPALWLAGLLLATAQVALAQASHPVQELEQSQEPGRAGARPHFLELRFQSELGNSTIVRRSGQQQVFKCQVRLAPVVGAQVGQRLAQRARLKSSSRWLAETSVEEPGASVWHGAAIAPALSASFNVSQLTIDWLKDGQWLLADDSSPLGAITVVNVTLETQHQQQQQQQQQLQKTQAQAQRKTQVDKTLGPRQARPRLEIKNTLNGAQLKLTSRLRLGQMRPADSGQFACVARARFVLAAPPMAADGSQARELVEQSLESTSATLIVLPNAPLDNPAGKSEGHQDGGGGGGGDGGVASASQFADDPILDHATRAPATAIKQQDQEQQEQQQQREHQQGRHSSGASQSRANGELAARPPQGSATSRMSADREQQKSERTPTGGLFEDDEDLFRLDSGELISDGGGGGGGGVRGATEDEDADGAPPSAGANDNGREQQIIGPADANNDPNGLLVGGVARHWDGRQSQHEARLDWMLEGRGELGDEARPVAGPDQPDASDQGQQQQQARPRPPAGGHHKIDGRWEPAFVSGASGGPSTLPGAPPPPPLPFDHRRPEEVGGNSVGSGPPGLGSASDPLAAPAAVARSKLARLVHRIVPESSCYTGAGELYRGQVAQAADQRVCLNWLRVRALLAAAAGPAREGNQNRAQQRQRDNQTISQEGEDSTQAARTGLDNDRDADHNFCRNPNGDPRGPWCFVAHSELLDGVIVAAGPQLSREKPIARKLLTRKHQVVRRAGELLVVASPCAQIVSCSEYLWLYVVAPPLGLLVLLTCLASFAVGSIRRSRCNAIFSAASHYQRHSELRTANARLTTSCPQAAAAAAGAARASAPSLGLSKLQLLLPPSGTRHRASRSSWRLVGGGGGGGGAAAPSLCCGLGRSRAKTPGAPRSRSNYLERHVGGRGAGSASGLDDDDDDDDIFEIVDDIDWSDGHTGATAVTSSASQSTMSPKSSESFNLLSVGAGGDCGPPPPLAPPLARASRTSQQDELLAAGWRARKPSAAQPLLSEQALDLQLSQRQQASARYLAGGAPGNKMCKSKSQVGPLFATLRCQVRNTHQLRLANSGAGTGTGNSSVGRHARPQADQPQAKKSSSFIEHHHYSNAGPEARETKPPAEGSASITSDLSASADQRTARLISCSATSSCSPSGSTQALALTTSNTSANPDQPDKLTLASELPQLDASSITLAYDAQLIFEGKFSKVQTAYIRQNKLDPTQATGRIGAQVAVCSLKQQGALSESLFHASQLRLHNLNHLNILKLIGYVQASELADAMDGRGPMGATPAKADLDLRESSLAGQVRCALVYDMAHLIDLSDWLKEQCKDAIVARQDEISGDLSLRQNLTCIAKQVALALDYLHDKNIVYKDLACRNCFLDATRMLVKLASFNIEPEFVSQEESPAYGHAGVPGSGGGLAEGANSNRITPNNYGDSAHNNQEAISKKLSLKSMVRPKYLLDYYVIDSRPSECQLLPLSWIPLESILFNKFNKQTDIWSLGCLLYELFSLGEVAYFGYSSKQVIDSVRSNMMPPQPLLCPNGIYKLMCKCLSDIPTLRPNIKHVYEQLNLYSGQCSSFLNHHLCMI